MEPNPLLVKKNQESGGSTFTQIPSPYSPNTQDAIRSFSAVSSNQARNEIKDATNIINRVDRNTEQREALSRDAIGEELLSLDQEDQSAFDLFQEEVSRLRNGLVDLSSDEKRMLRDIEDRYDILKRRQMVANQSLVGGVTEAAGRTGIARYAPGLANMEISGAVNAGIDRLKDIDMELDNSITRMRDAIIDGRVEAIKENYDGYTSRIKQRRDTLKELRGLISDAEKSENDRRRTDIAAANLSLSREKFEAEEGGDSLFADVFLTLQELGNQINPATQEPYTMEEQMVIMNGLFPDADPEELISVYQQLGLISTPGAEDLTGGGPDVSVGESLWPNFAAMNQRISQGLQNRTNQEN